MTSDCSSSQHAAIIDNAEAATYASAIAIRHLRVLDDLRVPDAHGLPPAAARRAKSLAGSIDRLTTRELLALLADAVDRAEGRVTA